MNNDSNIGLDRYNSFCSELRAGHILYNMDSSNGWGEYLLVVNITPVSVGAVKTYTVLLTGLRKQDREYVPCHLCISMTPDYAARVPFLKHVGYCKFSIIPILEDVNVNVGLAAVYGSTNLHKFASKLSIRKPRNRKYDSGGKPVIKKPGNKT